MNMATKKTRSSARILVETPIDDVTYKPNQVIEADVEVIKALVKTGNADDSAAAIKYCVNDLKAELIQHQSKGPSVPAASSADLGQVQAKALEMTGLSQDQFNALTEGEQNNYLNAAKAALAE